MACTNPSQPSLLLSIVSWFSQLCCNIKEVSSCQTVTRSETYGKLQHRWTLMMRRPEFGFDPSWGYNRLIDSMQSCKVYQSKPRNRISHESTMYHQIQNRPTGANHCQSIKLISTKTTSTYTCGIWSCLGDILRPASHLQTLCEMPQKNGKRLVAGRLQASQIASSVESSHCSKSEISTNDSVPFSLSQQKQAEIKLNLFVCFRVGSKVFGHAYLHIPSKACSVQLKYLSHLASNCLPSLIISISFQGFSTSPGHASW